LKALIAIETLTCKLLVQIESVFESLNYRKKQILINRLQAIAHSRLLRESAEKSGANQLVDLCLIVARAVRPDSKLVLYENLFARSDDRCRWLQNSILTENFSDKFSSSNFGKFSTLKTTLIIFMNLKESIFKSYT
jgi:hypothetical protein